MGDMNLDASFSSATSTEQLLPYQKVGITQKQNVTFLEQFAAG